MLQHGVSEGSMRRAGWAQWIRTAAMGSVRGNVLGVSRARERSEVELELRGRLAGGVGVESSGGLWVWGVMRAVVVLDNKEMCDAAATVAALGGE